jgi:uncharacterized protein (TIGR04141 family)
MTFSRVTVFLLQNTVLKAKDAISSEKQTVDIETRKDSGVEGTLFYQRSAARPPGWVTEVDPLLDERISGVVSASASGVLVLKTSERWFAVSFGYGRSLIDPAVIQRQFGLRVALNLVDPEQLRSMDTKTFEDLVVSKSTQSSKSSDLPAFGVDISRDILRGVAGVPRDKSVATRLHGSDAITLVCKPSADGLPAVCDRLLIEYQADTYKANFEWIDQLAVIDDPTERAALDAKVLASLRSRDTSSTYMAAPETVDWDDIEHYKIAPTGKTTYEDLDLDAYLAAMSDAEVASTTLQNLQQRAVTVTYSRSGNTDRLWNVYQCLISEQRVGGRLYVLIEGRWFVVDETLSDQVDTYFRGLSSATTLTDARPNETEPEYNERIAVERPDLYLHLDARIVRPGGAASGIEFCDLLGKDGTLIHVKRKSRSATLSHLFAQGSVAARTLISDGAFREGVRAAIVEKVGSGDPTSWLALVPDAQQAVDPRRYKISYVVLTKPPTGTADWMPFFSKLNLMQHGRELQTMSFGVSVSRLNN